MSMPDFTFSECEFQISMEVIPENDIILCDGACDRGFHQFCLDPPLKTEDSKWCAMEYHAILVRIDLYARQVDLM